VLNIKWFLLEVWSIFVPGYRQEKKGFWVFSLPISGILKENGDTEPWKPDSKVFVTCSTYASGIPESVIARSIVSETRARVVVTGRVLAVCMWFASVGFTLDRVDENRKEHHQFDSEGELRIAQLLDTEASSKLLNQNENGVSLWIFLVRRAGVGYHRWLGVVNYTRDITRAAWRVCHITGAWRLWYTSALHRLIVAKNSQSNYRKTCHHRPRHILCAMLHSLCPNENSCTLQ